MSTHGSMHARLSHSAVVLLALCYGSVSLAEPLESFARMICPGSTPQRITSAKSTKPMSGASYVVARRHLPLTKQIELPPHEAVVREGDDRAATVTGVLLPEPNHDVEQFRPTALRSRPPPPDMTVG